MPNPFIKANNLFVYQNNTLQKRTLIATASDATGANSLTNNVLYWDGASAGQSIFTPSLNAQAVRAVNSRDYEFFADGVAADLKAWNIASGTSNWGIVAPTSTPIIAATSGTNAPWVASTVFSTMGILVDANGNVEQLISVNATGANLSTTIGTTGVGQPNWNQTPGGTTTDTPVTWTNKGPIGLWKAGQQNTASGSGGGTLANPAVIFDPITSALYGAIVGNISGATYPNFHTGAGVTTNDGANQSWVFLDFVQSPTKNGITFWQPSHTYKQFHGYNLFTSNDLTNSVVVEPAGVLATYNPITNSFSQTIFCHASTTGGTTPATETNPFFAPTKGGLTDDNQLRWNNLGSATWPALTPVVAWQPNSKIFSAIKDSNGNIQVCIATGTTSSSAPTWATQYGATTTDGSSVVWTNVGTSLSWTANTKWFLPSTNFTAPQTTSSFGGASVIDSNNNLESTINSGKSGASAPTWSAVGSFTADGGTPLTLTQVSVAGAVTTYTGTITGGGSNAFAGFNFLIAGFATAGNNGVISVTSSTATTLVCTTTTQVNETHAGIATTGLIWFDVQATTVGSPGVVTLISPIGRRYFIVYLNSTKQNFSDLNPVSASTGPITNGQISLVSIPISPDPQVDQKVILATADGGDPSTLYFVGQIANSTTSFTDNTAEADLVLHNIYQQIDATGNDIGVVGNDPPPNGSFPTLHKGRVFMIFNNALAFSKSLPEITTSTGIVAGRFEEDWPPENVIPYTPGVEIGKGLLSDGSTLYIGTEQHIRRLFGDGDAVNNFSTPDVVFSETGLMTQNVWKIVFLEGTPVGSMWVTPDFRVIESDFNTYKDVGTPIQSTLNTINPAATQACWAQSVTYGPYNFYVLALATGNNTAPDTLCVFEMHLHKWYVWQFADNFLSGLFYVSLNGVPRWLMVDTNGNVRFVDTTVVTDRSTDTPVPITSTLRTTWLHFGDASMRKTLNEIELDTSMTGTLVTVEGATNTSDFTNPNIIATNLPLTANIFGQLKVFLSGLPIIYRFYRFTFTSASSASTSLTSDVLLGYFSAEILPLNRI